MAKKTSIIYDAKDGQKTVSRSITYVNPEASDLELYNFAQGLNALSTNVFNGARKVTTVDLDSSSGKQTPTLTLSQASMTVSAFNQAMSNDGYVMTTITYDGDGELFVEPTKTTTNHIFTRLLELTGGKTLWFTTLSNVQPTAGDTITLRASETDNYTAAEATFTITAG